MPVNTGPVQGEAMSPHTMPSTNAPRYPRPPTVASRLVSAAGNASSKAPNIEAAMAKNSTLIPTSTQLLCSTEPNMLPVRPAITPSGTNMATMPSTKRRKAVHLPSGSCSDGRRTR